MIGIGLKSGGLFPRRHVCLCVHEWAATLLDSKGWNSAQKAQYLAGFKHASLRSVGLRPNHFHSTWMSRYYRSWQRKQTRNSCFTNPKWSTAISASVKFGQWYLGRGFRSRVSGVSPHRRGSFVPTVAIFPRSEFAKASVSRWLRARNVTMNRLVHCGEVAVQAVAIAECFEAHETGPRPLWVDEFLQFWLEVDVGVVAQHPLGVGHLEFANFARLPQPGATRNNFRTAFVDSKICQVSFLIQLPQH